MSFASCIQFKLTTKLMLIVKAANVILLVCIEDFALIFRKKKMKSMIIKVSFLFISDLMKTIDILGSRMILSRI